MFTSDGCIRYQLCPGLLRAALAHFLDVHAEQALEVLRDLENVGVGAAVQGRKTML